MPYQLTAAQLELQAARKAAKLAGAATRAAAVPKLSPAELERRRILKREWVTIRQSTAKRRVRVVTWNILAQTLVRRELFPGSDCLKWGERKPMLLAELEQHSSADIICLQECDRLKDLLPAVPDHSHVYTSGRGKLHGLVVLYRSSRFRVRAQRTVYLDEEELSPPTSSPTLSNGDSADPNASLGINGTSAGLARRRGGSRVTKNVGLMVGLEDVQNSKYGVVIATTHLFWHPRFPYERTRQAILLLRAIERFKKEHKCGSWPTILAGDLNTEPREATYQLLIDPWRPLEPHLKDELEASRLIHHSLDKSRASLEPTAQTTTEAADTVHAGSITPEDDDDEENEDGEGDESQDKDEHSIAGTRPPIASDGLLSVPELIQATQSATPSRLLSAYDTVHRLDASASAETFASRGGFREHAEVMSEGNGRNEPAYSCFTPLFRLTLDYLLLFEQEGVTITELLKPARTDELGEGLPRRGIGASDHLAVGCEIAW